MAKKNDINVERIGANTGRPITTNPVPVRRAVFTSRVPLSVFPNGTIVESTVDRDGTNNQVFYKSNGTPSYGLRINGADSTALRYNRPEDILAYKKYKPGTPEFKKIARDSKQYDVPVVTYDESENNFDEVQRQVNAMQHGGEVFKQVDSFQYGGPIVPMVIQPKEEFTEDEKQALSNGTFYEETTYPDGYHVTRLSSGTKGKNQRYPFIYSKMVAPDGSVLYQQDQYRNYPLINKSPKVIDINDVSYNLGDGETWFNKYKSAIDGENLNSPRTKTNRENDLLEYQKGGEILKAWGGKKLSGQMSNEDAQALHSGTYRKSYTDEFGNKIEAKPAVWKNGSIGNGLVYRAITPQNDTLYNTVGFDLEPSDVPGYQTVVPWGGTYTNDYDNNSSDWERSETELAKRLSVPDIRQQYGPVGNEAPMPNMQEGGEVPSNDQQQLFVAIITDMANTLGVEPSQEFAKAVMTAFENNDDSQGLLTLFTETKNKFMNETGLFREGGKMYAFVEKFKCGGKAKKTAKKQEGGEVEDTGAAYITTPVNDRQMRRNWRQATGGTRREARQVQRDLANNFENMGGISHRGAMNSAAAMMGDSQRFATPQEPRVLGGVSTPTLNVPAPQLGTPASLENNYDNFDFNTAFGRARGNGENTFMWRGKEYTTELAPEKKSVVSNPDLLMGSPTVGGSNYNPTTNPLYKLGANWRANRDARRAARQNDPTPSPGAVIGATAATGAAFGSTFGPLGTLVGAGIGAGGSYLARRRAQQNQVK